MDNREVIKEIKSLADKLGKIADRGIAKGELSGIETEIIIDSVKSIYNLAVDLAGYGIPEDEYDMTPKAEPATESILESILGETAEEKSHRQEHPTEEIVIEKIVKTEIKTPEFAPPIDPAVINSLYGDEPSDEDAEEPEPAPAQTEEGEGETEIMVTISETIRETVIFNETVESHNGKNLADKISAGSVDSLRKSIGINDKFLLMRDLFGNEPEKYNETIDTLDGFEDVNDAFIYLQENFTVNPDSDGVKLLISLLERKNA